MPVPETYKPTDTMAESKHLRAADFPLDTKWKLDISDVNLEEMPAREGENKGPRKKLILSFKGKQKTLVLNATNQGFLEQRLGKAPNTWIGATIVLHRTTAKYQGQTVPGFLVIECYRGEAPAVQDGEF